MTRYHVSPQDGIPRRCTASLKDCKYGANTPHFKNREEALKYIEENVKVDGLKTFNENSKISKNNVKGADGEVAMKTFKSVKEFQNKSKELSFILRHKPETIGLEVTSDGFGSVEKVLSGMDISRGQLGEIVDLDSKGRFEFSRDGKTIRARQGHSFKVDLGLEEVEPPEFLYHGTTVRAWDSIKKSGLRPMKRHAVHLSENLDTAATVASRRKDETVILKVYAGKMFKDGYKFTRTSNNVWLTETVPNTYLEPLK